jgi:hypothetical protein
MQFFNTQPPAESKEPPASLDDILIFGRYPQDEMYRLFVDGVLVTSEKGWILYANREPGCLASLCRAAEVAFSENINNTTLSVSFIQRLHELCTQGVSEFGGHDKKFDKTADVLPGKFRCTLK